jgi:hypothetical protein
MIFSSAMIHSLLHDLIPPSLMGLTVVVHYSLKLLWFGRSRNRAGKRSIEIWIDGKQKSKCRAVMSRCSANVANPSGSID